MCVVDARMPERLVNPPSSFLQDARRDCVLETNAPGCFLPPGLFLPIVNDQKPLPRDAPRCVYKFVHCRVLAYHLLSTCSLLTTCTFSPLSSSNSVSRRAAVRTTGILRRASSPSSKQVSCSLSPSTSNPADAVDQPSLITALVSASEPTAHSWHRPLDNEHRDQEVVRDSSSTRLLVTL